jgi:hypothetical protein
VSSDTTEQLIAGLKRSSEIAYKQYAYGFADTMDEAAERLTRLRNAIIDVLDRLEPEESASLEGESYKPNLAMTVCSTLREAIGERNG